MSAFSEKVYKAVSKIPKGKVSTYKEVAKTIGSPKTVRAVGQVLKTNKHPEKIPCYKIVRSDGNLGGYCGSGKKNIQKKLGY
ncbi:MAG TPA: MGMT family protein [archaeon]|nr:MGMT family protein [archaeon]